jgi:hypothetical protein
LKKCPVCGATLFDDAKICYGCMYEFGSDSELEIKKRNSQNPILDQTIATDDSEEKSATNDLFCEFLVEFHGFLGDFLFDRKIEVK